MIRNQRRDSGIDFTKRKVVTVPLALSDEEWELYEGVTTFVKDLYRSETGFKSTFSLITLQREICSSRYAAYVTLSNMYKKAAEGSPIRRAIETLLEPLQKLDKHTKAEKVLELIQSVDDKVIIFTEYRATQEYLQYILAQHGITSVLFRGGFKRNKKDWMQELFEKRAKVLIATEAGGEGLNLQFCRNMINYDMPWNPMKVEQRIGRIHRLGQTKDVNIYNLCTQRTIEEYILRLLYEKINLFEMVIGELDAILEKLSLSKSFEANIADILLGSDSEREMAIKFDNMSQVLKSFRDEIRQASR